MKLYINVVFFDHLMLQVPPRASAQLRHNRIAFPEHIDIEIDVLAGLSERFSTRCESRRDHEIGGGTYFARNVDLRCFWRQKPADFGDGRDLEGCANHDDEVHEIFIVLREAIVESCREVFTEEGDVRLGRWLVDNLIGFKRLK